MRAATLYVRSAGKGWEPECERLAIVHSRDGEGVPATIEVRLLSGVATVAGAARKLSGADYAILAELALEQRWYDSGEVIEDLYPELDSVTAANRLYVATHRLRKRIHRDIVKGGSSGYRIGPNVWVDLLEAEVLIRKRATHTQPLTTDELDRVRTLSPLVRAELIALTARSRLRSGLEFRVTEARRLLLAAAAASASEIGAAAQSLQFSEALIADDECDEDGNLYRARALMCLHGKRAAEDAWNGYRRALHVAKYPEPGALFSSALNFTVTSPSWERVAGFCPLEHLETTTPLTGKLC